MSTGTSTARDAPHFEGKVARRNALGRGPQTLFCRAFCKLGVQELATAKSTAQAEPLSNTASRIPKPVMALLTLLADERSRGRSNLMNQLRPEAKAVASASTGRP